MFSVFKSYPKHYRKILSSSSRRLSAWNQTFFSFEYVSYLAYYPTWTKSFWTSETSRKQGLVIISN